MGPGSNQTELLRMEGVTVCSARDPSVVVAEGISWTVAPNEFWVIAGLQGSGKSDFLMMTGGVTAPASGRYRLLGEEMPIFDEARLAHRLKLGLVFDGGQLLNQLTVAENVALPLRYHRNLSAAEARGKVMQTLEAMELAPWADSTPGNIGRIWQQRVGLARALMLKPEILLVDNPLAGLDSRHLRWWLQFLERLSEGDAMLDGKALTLIVTTADMRPWRSKAGKFALLRNRRFTVLGTWDQAMEANAELVQELMPLETRSG
jgi:ABC-type transporter Mla maintaining outer membrane lipid asymmetry ATPase subunit MlaF